MVLLVNVGSKSLSKKAYFFIHISEIKQPFLPHVLRLPKKNNHHILTAMGLKKPPIKMMFPKSESAIFKNNFSNFKPSALTFGLILLPH